jgi:GTP-binding protein EngB required for normal cell division
MLSSLTKSFFYRTYTKRALKKIEHHKHRSAKWTKKAPHPKTIAWKQRLATEATKKKQATSPLKQSKTVRPSIKELQRKRAEKVKSALEFNPLNWKIVVVGRPNVGKSTLFNRLAGSKSAIVHDLPGVTRDRKDSLASLAQLEFRLTDTAGLEETHGYLTSNSAAQLIHKKPLKLELQKEILHQTEYAIKEADIIILMFDARTGLVPLDSFFASWYNKRYTNFLLSL